MGTRKMITRLRILSIVLAALLLIGIAAGVLMKISDNRRIAALEAQLAQLQGGSEKPVQAANAYPADAAAAEFKGGVVTVGEASEAYALIASYYEMMGADEAEYAEEAKKETLRSLVEDRILEQKAKEYGVYEISEEQRAEIEAEVKESFDANVDYYLDFRFDESVSEDELRQETIEYLAENGYEYDALVEDAMQNVWRDNLRERMISDIEITDENVRAYFDSQAESAAMRYAADFSEYEADREMGGVVVWNPAGVRTVQAILIAFDNDQIHRYLELQTALENGETDKLSQIDALYAELEPRVQEVRGKLASGEDFLTIADQYSEDGNLAAEPARSTGYYVSAQSESYGDDFAAAAMALENIGDISEPVNVDGGIYILRYVSDVPEGAVAYEDVADSLRIQCEEEIKAEKYNDIVEQWIEEADVKYYTDRF